MKLHEALKTGKKFRRNSWKVPSMFIQIQGEKFYDEYNLYTHEITTEEILAEDWEIFND